MQTVMHRVAAMTQTEAARSSMQHGQLAVAPSLVSKFALRQASGW